MGHFVYILKCSDQTLYTGYTTDIEKRCVVHNTGKGAKYTRTRLPVEVVYSEEYDTKTDAMRREYRIKQMTRREKLKLINKFGGCARKTTQKELIFLPHGHIYTCMNEKIQTILLKIILELKRSQWTAHPDWEVTLKGEGHVPLVKPIAVEGSMKGKTWDAQVEITMDLKLETGDQITYFPDYTIFGQIFMRGCPVEDILYKMDADVAFTAPDFSNDRKIKSAADKINRLVDSHIQTEFNDYVATNHENIEYYKKHEEPAGEIPGLDDD